MKKESKKQKKLSGKTAFEMGEITGIGTIIVLALMIAAVVLFVNFRNTPNIENAASETNLAIEPIDVIEPDVIRNTIGEGKITWVQYSDLECPLCKRFYPTATSVRGQLNDRVAYSFKHFPSGAYERSFLEAEATECVGEQDEQAFFVLIDRIYETTPSRNGLTDEALLALVQETGIDMEKFATCQDERRYADIVINDIKEAKAAGGTGTPFNVFIDKEGTIIKTIAGAINEEQLLETINGLLD